MPTVEEFNAFGHGRLPGKLGILIKHADPARFAPSSRSTQL